MNNIHDNKNYAQALLYQAGQRTMGPERAESATPSHVRKEGVKHLGKRAMQATLFTLGLIGAVEFMGNSFDRSPTVQPYRQPQGEQATPSTVPVQHLDLPPTDVVVRVSEPAENK